MKFGLHENKEYLDRQIFLRKPSRSDIRVVDSTKNTQVFC
jgi:hypothetical protein